MKTHPVWNVLSHATTIGSAMFIVFFCIDRVNPAMDFLRSNLSKWCLLAYCVMSLITALCSAVFLFKRSKFGVKQHPVHRQAEEEPVRYNSRQTAHRSRNYGGAGRNTVSVGESRNAYYMRGRETLHDTRYGRAQ